MTAHRDAGDWPLPTCSGGTVPNGEVYRSMREDVLALVHAADGAIADRAVPACPSWTVKDLLAHLSGVAADVLDGRLDGVATDGWTAVQVSARQEWSLAQVVEEWSANGPSLDAAFDDLGPALDPRALIDTWIHQQDLRAALGVAPSAAAVGRCHCAQVLLDRVGGLVDGGLVPRVRVELDGVDRLDRGDRVVLRTSTHEWARGLLGRRSRRQVLAWPWVGEDPLGFVDELAVFPWSTNDQRG